MKEKYDHAAVGMSTAYPNRNTTEQNLSKLSSATPLGFINTRIPPLEETAASSPSIWDVSQTGYPTCELLKQCIVAGRLCCGFLGFCSLLILPGCFLAVAVLGFSLLLKLPGCFLAVAVLGFLHTSLFSTDRLNTGAGNAQNTSVSRRAASCLCQMGECDATVSVGERTRLSGHRRIPSAQVIDTGILFSGVGLLIPFREHIGEAHR